MLIVLSMAALCNIPYVFEHHLFRGDVNNNITYDPISFSKSELLVYDKIMYIALTVCLPVIILIVTVKVIVVLRRNQNNMQNSNTLNIKINTVLITILLTFIICQFPLLVNRILASIIKPECGSLYFYFSGLASALLVLNFAAHPFVYLLLRNHFARPLRHTLRKERAGTIEMGSM